MAETVIIVQVISISANFFSSKLFSLYPIYAIAIETGCKKTKVDHKNVMLDIEVRPSK